MKPSVLIVDDHTLICDGLERLLRSEYTVYKAYNGREALDMFRENGHIDIILSDIMMPVMDGIEMVERVRSDNKDVIIIAMTAVYSGEIVSEVIEKGADYCLMKPVDVSELKLTIRKFIEKRRSDAADTPFNIYPQNRKFRE